jgi:hypothetical protein
MGLKKRQTDNPHNLLAFAGDNEMAQAIRCKVVCVQTAVVQKGSNGLVFPGTHATDGHRQDVFQIHDCFPLNRFTARTDGEYVVSNENPGTETVKLAIAGRGLLWNRIRYRTRSDVNIDNFPCVASILHRVGEVWAKWLAK